MEGIQKALSQKFSRGLIKLEEKLQKELDNVLHQEEMLWFQKSRMEAIRDGDRNTKIFHLSTVIRRKRNRIDMLKNNEGTWVSKVEDVKNMVVDYWKELFTEEGQGEVVDYIAPGCFPMISEKDFDALTRKYADCEVTMEGYATV